MIRKYIIVADDSIKGFDEEVARLEREWGAEEIEPCDDCISRKDALKEAYEFLEIGYNGKGIFRRLKELPSVTPSFEEWLSSFNTDSAPQCFNAVQELKKQIEKKQNT